MPSGGNRIPSGDKMGEAPKAYVVRDSNALVDQDIIEALRRDMPVYKVPSVIEFIDSLPKNESGKIMKTQLKEREGRKT